MTSPDGHRYYPHPTRRDPDGSPTRYLSVTTALNDFAKAGLPPWAGMGTAVLALDSVPQLLRAVREHPCGKGRADDRCKRCAACAAIWLADWHRRESAKASDRGKRLHYAVSLWAGSGGLTPSMDDDIQPYFAQWMAFVADHGIEPEDVLHSEAVIMNHSHVYAGTLDMIVRVCASRTVASAELVTRITGWPAGTADILIDVKTREKPEYAAYADRALQVTGYARGEALLFWDGTEEPMPHLDGGMIVQVSPTTYHARPVDTGDETFGAFLTYMAAYRWNITQGARVVGARAFELPDELQGTQAAKDRVVAAREREAALAANPDAETCPCGYPLGTKHRGCPLNKRGPRKTPKKVGGAEPVEPVTPLGVPIVHPGGDDPVEQAARRLRDQHSSVRESLRRGSTDPFDLTRSAGLADDDIPF